MHILHLFVHMCVYAVGYTTTVDQSHLSKRSSFFSEIHWKSVWILFTNVNRTIIKNVIISCMKKSSPHLNFEKQRTHAVIFAK